VSFSGSTKIAATKTPSVLPSPFTLSGFARYSTRPAGVTKLARSGKSMRATRATNSGSLSKRYGTAWLLRRYGRPSTNVISDSFRDGTLRSR
jgi:hypothetical protein